MIVKCNLILAISKYLAIIIRYIKKTKQKANIRFLKGNGADDTRMPRWRWRW